MFEKLPQSNGNVISDASGGTISEADMQTLDRAMQALVEHYGTFCLLVTYNGAVGLDLDALDDDLWMLRFLGSIERMAVVADNRLYEQVASA